MSAQLEAEKKDFESQLELVVSSLKDDPDNVELANLKTELEGMIQFINDSIAELKPKSAPGPKSRVASPPPPPPPPPPPADEQPKWSRENHPAFKKTSTAAPEPEPQQPEVVTYQVNDTVMAKWMTGDKGFYPARITSITGSSTNPIYTVKFKSYDTVETLRGKDIRPMTAAASGQGQAQKRKADSMSSASAPAPAAPTAATTTNNGIVLSATPELYPQPPPKPEGDNEKPKPKFKKIKANKELEAGKNKWQEFTAKGKMGKSGGGGGGLGGKKESMFRTPEGVKGRVGFTGSGQAMRKDPTRTRHVYQPNEDLD